MQASVVIFAVGRNRLLPWMIRGAVAQTVPAEDYEVIVVEGENANHPESSPGESDVWRAVSAQALTSPVRIRYLYVPDSHPNNMLHAARRAARGSCLVMLPADRVVGEEWLADALYGHSAVASARLVE
ncbi:MAG: hypothetical protein ACYC3S_15985 [Chloroflexota bacterium]